VAVNDVIDARVLSEDGVKETTRDLHDARKAWSTSRCKRDTARDEEANISQVNQLAHLSAESEWSARDHDRSFEPQWVRAAKIKIRSHARRCDPSLHYRVPRERATPPGGVTAGPSLQRRILPAAL
jgi:hypothetical protein